MKYIRLIIFMVMIAGVVSGVTWDGSQRTLTSRQAEAQLYKPPLRRATPSRVRNGTRGPGDRLPSLWVLAPDHMGLTVHDQPELYWYLSKSSRHPVEITLSDQEAIDPLFELRLQPPVTAGIHRTRLAEHGIRLKPNVPYEWFVALLANPEDPSQDIVSRGTIQHVAPSDSRQQQVHTALQKAVPTTNAWRIYASAGIWYDAMAMLSTLIEKTPRDAALRQQRAVLLDEVSLPEVAAYSRKIP